MGTMLGVRGSVWWVYLGNALHEKKMLFFFPRKKSSNFITEDDKITSIYAKDIPTS
jgi:hypothetical protein